MRETIEKLLILQERDKQINRFQTELAHIEPERAGLKMKASEEQASLERVRHRQKELESKRKDLELEVESRKQLIERYANQQLETRKNEEYRALAHEIEMCKEAIFKIEDQEIELMEQEEGTKKESVVLTKAAAETRKLVDDQLGQLERREQNIRKELADLEENRQELAMAVEEPLRRRYERLAKGKGGNVVVGVQHGVCGGCHMRLPAQVLVTCQGQTELVTCTNCGRILYYTRDMDLAAVD